MKRGFEFLTFFIGLICAIGFVGCDISGLKETALTQEEVVELDAEWLNADMLGYSFGDNSLDVKNDFSTPIKAKNGSIITWASNSPYILSINSKTGGVKIERPLDNDATVDIEAKISKGSAYSIKKIRLLFKKYSDKEKVDLERIYVTADIFIYSEGDNSSDVKSKFRLPLLGKYGGLLEWTADSQLINIDKDSGEVYILKNPDSDSVINLFLKIKIGSAEDTKVIGILLKSKSIVTPTTTTAASASTTTTTVASASTTTTTVAPASTTTTTAAPASTTTTLAIFPTYANIGSIFSAYPIWGMGDLNNDGKVDAISFVSSGVGGIKIYSQDPIGTFTQTQALSTVISDASKDVYGADIGDLDGDGYPDYITAGPNGANTSLNAVFRNSNGTFALTGTTTYMSNSVFFYGSKVKTAKLNSDNFDDVVWFVSNNVYVGLSNGSQGFTSITALGGTFVHGVYGYDISDADNDGNLDIIHSSCYNGDGNGSIEIFKGDGAGGFTHYTSLNQATYSSVFTNFMNPFGIKAADFNNDGKNDIIFHNKAVSGNATYGLWLGIRTSENNTSPVYEFSKVDNSVFNSSIAMYIDVADWNQDGNLDFLAISNTSGTVLFTGDGAGNFSQKTISTSGGYKAVFIDVNQDGKLDIACSASSYLRVYYQ